MEYVLLFFFFESFSSSSIGCFCLESLPQIHMSHVAEVLNQMPFLIQPRFLDCRRKLTHTYDLRIYIQNSTTEPHHLGMEPKTFLLPNDRPLHSFYIRTLGHFRHVAQPNNPNMCPNSTDPAVVKSSSSTFQRHATGLIGDGELSRKSLNRRSIN